MFKEELANKNIKMLINNVGVVDRKRFFDMTPEEIQNIMAVNMFTPVFMTKYALQHMISKKSDRFALVHFSSIIGPNAVLPFHALYAGNKKFTNDFGLSLDKYL